MKNQHTEKYPPVFLTVWQEAWQAIRRPRHYVRWVFQPFWRSIKYLMVICFVMSIATTIFFYLQIRPFLHEVKEKIEESLPTIVYSDGEIEVDNDQTYSWPYGGDVFIKVDPTQSLEEEPHIDSFYVVGLLVVKDGFLLGGDGQYDDYKFNKIFFEDFTITGAGVSKWLGDFLSTGIFFVPLILFAYFLISKLLFTVFFSFLYYLFSGFKLNFIHLWSIALYALTPTILAWYIIFVFFHATGLATIVFLIYMTLAILNYRKFLIFNAQSSN